MKGLLRLFIFSKSDFLFPGTGWLEIKNAENMARHVSGGNAIGRLSTNHCRVRLISDRLVSGCSFLAAARLGGGRKTGRKSCKNVEADERIGDVDAKLCAELGKLVILRSDRATLAIGAVADMYDDDAEGVSDDWSGNARGPTEAAGSTP